MLVSEDRLQAEFNRGRKSGYGEDPVAALAALDVPHRFSQKAFGVLFQIPRELRVVVRHFSFAEHILGRDPQERAGVL